MIRTIQNMKTRACMHYVCMCVCVYTRKKDVCLSHMCHTTHPHTHTHTQHTRIRSAFTAYIHAYTGSMANIVVRTTDSEPEKG